MSIATASGGVIIEVTGARGGMGTSSGPLGAGSVDAETVTDDSGEQEAIVAKLGLADIAAGIHGDDATRTIDSNVGGTVIPADDAPIFIGHNISGVDGIIIDTGPAFPPGIACRRYRGTSSVPLLVGEGDQLGYNDYRAFSGGQFVNAASLDVVVSGEVPFSNGDIPPTKMRFATAYDDHPKVHMELLPRGRLELGAIQGEDYLQPSGIDPKLFAVQTAADWCVSFAARPPSGAGYALHCETKGETASDYLIGGVSGASPTLKFSVRGNGDVLLTGVLKVDDVQVVGPQGAAVANATDAASAITQLNLLLARMRAHGLIAT